MAKLRFVFLGILFSLLSSEVVAKRVQVLDADGQPVANAVISIPGQTQAAPAEQLAVMDQVNKRFDPELLVIQRGQQVSFPNSDDIRHHVYSFSAAKSFEIKLYKGTDAPPITFEQPGVVVLGCNIHDAMIGYIYVKGNEATYVSDANGYVELPEQVPATLYAWHPHQILAPGQRSQARIDSKTNNILLPFKVKISDQPQAPKQKQGFQRRKLGG